MLLYNVHASTFNCEIRTESTCLSNQTLLLRMNSSESGVAPNNSHAQLANFSGTSAEWSLCCWTDSFRTLQNSCQGNGLRILGLESTNNSHVQVGTNTSYAWSACMNVTSGNISCEYPVSSCSAGYTGILSIASSEHADNTSNAHVATYGNYTRSVCCRIGGQNPPTVAYANLTPLNTTKRFDLSCENGTVTDIDGDAVTLHYNWYVNGSNLMLLNLPMDYDDTNDLTHDISGRGFHGTPGTNDPGDNPVFLPTGGYLGGAFAFDGINDSIDGSITGSWLNATYAISLWVRTDGVGDPEQTIFANDVGGSNSCPRIRHNAGSSVVVTAQVGNTLTYAVDTSSWTHVVLTNDISSDVARLYINGDLVDSDISLRCSQDANNRYILGRSPYDLHDFDFNGTIDEVLIFNRSLTAGEAYSLYHFNNKVLNRTGQQKTDYWNCSITPVDSTGLNGSTVYSNESFVNASVPDAPTLLYPADNNQSVFERYLNFSWSTVLDPDGDVVNYTINVTVTAGVCSVEFTQNNIQTINYTYGELCVDQLYNWSVRSCDIDGCSAYSSISNFTIASVLAITMVNNNTNFGTLSIGQSVTTDNYTITPFLLRNDGNVYANITFVGNNSPFSSVGLDSVAFQFRVEDNETNSINISDSQLTYTPVPSAFTHAIKQLNYSDVNDVVATHINITVPINEPPGTKEANVTFHATMS